MTEKASRDWSVVTSVAMVALSAASVATAVSALWMLNGFHSAQLAQTNLQVQMAATMQQRTLLSARSQLQAEVAKRPAGSVASLVAASETSDVQAELQERVSWIESAVYGCYVGVTSADRIDLVSLRDRSERFDSMSAGQRAEYLDDLNNAMDEVSECCKFRLTQIVTDLSRVRAMVGELPNSTSHSHDAGRVAPRADLGL